MTGERLSMVIFPMWMKRLLLLAVLVVSAHAGTARALESGEVLNQEILRPWTGDLDGMKKRRVLRVLVPISQTFFFIDKGQLRGLAVEALAEFEKKLNSTLGLKRDSDRIAVALLPTARDQLISGLVEGRGDLAVGSLTITNDRKAIIQFSNPIYSKVSEFVVTPAGATDIHKLSDLAGREIYARRSSSYYESLVEANSKPELKANPIRILEADEFLEDEELLEMVNAQLLPATVMDSYQFAFWHQFFDDVTAHPAVPLRTRGEIGWAMRKNSTQLLNIVNAFVVNYRKGSLLGNILFKRYLKSTKWLTNLKSANYRQKIEELRSLFEKYGVRYHVDWRLVAAQSFQESRFDNSLKSPTGAMGLMQIRPSTAHDPNIAINDISKPDGNVHAGVKYLRFIVDEYFNDPAIDEKNRILLALAAYNAGPNRIAALRADASNPNVWFDQVEQVVAENVGMEPVRYVSNIYRYFLVISKL